MQRSVASGLIAVGVVMAICYWAASLIETILASILLAILLDPAVELLRRLRLPRSLAAFFAVLGLLSVFCLSLVVLQDRAEEFTKDLPRHSTALRNWILSIRHRMEQLQRQTDHVIPPSQETVQTVTMTESYVLTRYFFPGFESIYNLFLMLSFTPFLVFFLLTWKDHLSRSIVEMFAGQDHPGIANSLSRIATVVRSYLLGNALVGVILSAASALLFLALGLRFALILGLLSGFLNLIPYLGALLAIAGPVVLGLEQLQSTEYLILIGCLAGFHVIALNVLLPKIVGPLVHLNPVAATFAILIWGWLWGAVGLVLAMPIAAGLKAVCDNFPQLAKLGRLLGEETG